MSRFSQSLALVLTT